jgi:hypothetical protein
MKKFLLLLWVIALMGGCSGAVDRTAQLDDIREATFRYQFVKNASGLQQNAKVYFLAITDPRLERPKNPSDTFLARFAGNHPRVAKVSASDSTAMTGVKDKQTGEQRLIFNVGAIRWISNTTVEVDGGYYEASESAAGSTYYLVKKDGRWIVQRDVMHWIS